MAKLIVIVFHSKRPSGVVLRSISHIGLTLRFSGGVKRGPLQPVVMPRTHATPLIRKDQNRQGLPCGPALQHVSVFTPS